MANDYAGGQVTLKANMISRNLDGTTNNSFPQQNLLGIMAGYKMTIDVTDDLTLMGGFYSGDLFEVEPYNITFIGAVVADRFKMKGTPSFYHVPAIGEAWEDQMRMIGGGGADTMTLASWREIGVN